jgi:hypothetical protein
MAHVRAQRGHERGRVVRSAAEDYTLERGARPYGLWFPRVFPRVFSSRSRQAGRGVDQVRGLPSAWAAKRTRLLENHLNAELVRCFNVLSW